MDSTPRAKLSLAWREPPGASDAPGVGPRGSARRKHGDVQRLCDLPDFDGSESWKNFLSVAVLVQPFGRLDGDHQEFTTA